MLPKTLKTPPLNCWDMNRRQALRNIGLGAGVLVVGPTTLSLLQSCRNESTLVWQPTFLSTQNGFALQQILEVILPLTDTPGANDLNIAQFIDSYMNHVADEKHQRSFVRSANSLAVAFKHQFHKIPEAGGEEEYKQMVEKYLKALPEQLKGSIKRNTETQDPMDEDPEDYLNSDTDVYAYMQEVRQMGIWAWKNSEVVGENVLWYDPIPGIYIPCGTVEELGNGKTMSL